MQHRQRVLSISLAVLAITLSIPLLVPRASAQTDAAEIESEARARFQLGQLYYSQARFAEAAAEFEAAYAAQPHPLLLHNLYLARRDLGDLPGAVDALTRYLAIATDLSASDRRLLEGRLQTMERQVAAMPAPQPEPELEVVDPTLDSIREAPSELEATVAPPPRPEGLGLVPGGLVLGVGAAGLIGAAIAAGIAEGVRSERDGMCTLEGGACPSSVDQTNYAIRFGSARDAGWVLFAAGAVISTVGAVLLGVGASAPSEQPAVTAACDANGCSAMVTGSF